MRHPAYVVKKSDNNLFYFELTDRNGNIILTSEYHLSKAGCYTTIKLCKRISQYEKHCIRAYNSTDQYYFTLIDENSNVIGSSNMFNNFWDRERTISAIKEIGPIAFFNDIS